MTGRLRLLCAAVAATVVVSGSAACGVRLQESPESVPAPTAAPPPPAVPPARAGQAVVYLVQDGRLAPSTVPAAGQGPEQALGALLTLTGPQDRRRSAVPAGTTLRALSVDGDLIVVDLDRRFAEARGRDAVLAVAQVVFTVTERPPARRVRLTVDGADLPLPIDGGQRVGEPVTRQAFASLTPAG